jgi:hypothetical protein
MQGSKGYRETKKTAFVVSIIVWLLRCYGGAAEVKSLARRLSFPEPCVPALALFWSQARIINTRPAITNIRFFDIQYT